MPTYRYECVDCTHIHEVFQSINDEERPACPDCGGRMDRLIGRGGGVLLKGDGFYTTEYRSESYKKAEKKDREAPKEPGSKKDSKGPDTGKKE